MIEVIVGLAALGLLGYIAYKMIVKHETPLEAVNEIKNEVVHEVKHLEEIIEHQVDETLTSLENDVPARAKAIEDEKRKQALRYKDQP